MEGRSKTDPAASAGAAAASTATNISIDEMREKLVIDATTTASNPRAALTNVGLPDATGIREDRSPGVVKAKHLHESRRVPDAVDNGCITNGQNGR